MDTDEREDKMIYKVVVDHEEQYSIWPADRENPLGWTDAGKMGTNQECQKYIKEVGKGKKSRSLMDEMEQRAPEETGGERGDL
jgi:MbtH protein